MLSCQGNSIYFLEKNRIFSNKSASRAASNIIFFLNDTIKLRLNLMNKAKRSLSQNVHIQSGVIFSSSYIIFTKYHIKTPMQLVFNTPMFSGSICNMDWMEGKEYFRRVNRNTASLIKTVTGFNISLNEERNVVNMMNVLENGMNQAWSVAFADGKQNNVK